MKFLLGGRAKWGFSRLLMRVHALGGQCERGRRRAEQPREGRVGSPHFGAARLLCCSLKINPRRSAQDLGVGTEKNTQIEKSAARGEKQYRGTASALFYGRGSSKKKLTASSPTLVPVTGQEAINRPNIDWQEKIHRGILRGLRNISETP